jgi:hypothetical protein
MTILGHFASEIEFRGTPGSKLRKIHKSETVSWGAAGTGTAGMTVLGHLASEIEFRGTPEHSYLRFIKLELLVGKTGTAGVCVYYCVFRGRGK